MTGETVRPQPVVHVVPVNDLITHLIRDCPCGPDAIESDGGIVVVHHSLDGRENIEG